MATEGTAAPKSREEIELEKFVFGDIEGFESALAETGLSSDESVASDDDNDDEVEDTKVDDESLFFIDEGASDSAKSAEPAESGSGSDDSDLESDMEDVAAAWHDSDDDDMRVSLQSSTRLRKLRASMAEDFVTGQDYERRLRSHFTKMHPKPKWVVGDSKASNNSDDEMDVDSTPDPLKDFLSRTTSYVSTRKPQFLPAKDLDIQRLADVTRQQPVPAAVQSLDFHPTHPLVLEAGYDRTLRVFHVDGKSNPLATSLHIKDSPFQTARFHPDGTRIFAGGRRRYLYMWDLETGALDKVSRMYGHGQSQRSMEKFVLSPDGAFVALIGGGGWMNVLSAATGQWVAGAKVDDGVIADVAWTRSDHVTLVTTGGDVYVWDVSARQFRSRWRDVGAVGVTSIAQTDRWVAVGATNGMVNVYDDTNPATGGIKLSSIEPETRTPTYVLENLVTPISTLDFSPDGQMLLMASRAKRDALRIAHVPSFSVFKNWPTSSTPLGNVTSASWAPHSGMLAAGNEGGSVRLWTLNHYA